MSIQMVGAVEIPLPPIVGNGMVGNIIINKGGEGRLRRPSPPKTFTLDTRHHSAANAVSGGTSTRPEARSRQG